METQTSILVVDDEQIICDSCQRILSKEDFKVDTDTNPVAGIQKALANHYDLVLLDLNMRELDGMQFLTKLRKDKPDLPVIIITGYPTKETKDESRNLGVINYILKPFKPSEILEPVMNIIRNHVPAKRKEVIDIDQLEATTSFKPSEKNFWFYKNAWLQKSDKGLVKVGGQFPFLLNEAVASVKFVEAGENIRRGFPIAQINFPNDIKLIIPSPVSGKVAGLNSAMLEKPSIFEADDYVNNWIATIIPDNLEEDLKMCETRKVILFSSDAKNKYLYQLNNLGYVVNTTSSEEETAGFLKNEMEKVIVFDAVSYGDKGPQHVKTLKEKLPSAKIIVFNVTDTKIETAFREQKIFYYAVDPIMSKETSSILYGAFCFAKDREPAESKQTTFLPPTINRVSITNKHSQKVVLIAFDNILQFNKGAGYLLLQKLHEKLYPVEINHTRYVTRMKDPLSAQMITKEQIRSERIIILSKEDLGKIPGSISRQTEKYENASRPDNTMIRISIQPEQMEKDEFVLDASTARALADMLENEMSSK